jgi:hypothetical protein
VPCFSYGPKDTPANSLQLIHNMLTGESLSFYRAISSKCTSLEDARVRVEAEFMSVTRPNAARRELE